MLKLKNPKNNDGNGKARRGEISLEHGIVQTPFFMTVGTIGTIKGIEADKIKDFGAEIILSNTYHLHLQPGDELIKELGGLHKFMNWDRPILTDSGGFQVFSLGKIRKITEKGVDFRSHISGEKISLTPESVMEIEHNLGVDIAMVLDECPPFPAEKKYVLQSLERTTRWAKRCIEHHKKIGSNKFQKLFAIVQGGVYADLREMSAKQLTEMDFDGFAIGGVSVGEPTIEMYRAVDNAIPFLPEKKPRYLMGVGTPENILETVGKGIDMFDCVMPTREARHGRVYTKDGYTNIKASKYKKDLGPIDEGCICPACTKYSRAYVRHLFASGEALGQILATYHNIAFYQNLMKEIREAIEENRFLEYKENFLKRYSKK
ncbi:tRNA guanosine(34) transglycosylase Tgt [Candidatus Gracilibacteria bacterium]|nr:tRNA guanosine(34) transglycosylase Tgt [Candidatus Gracilibacteria bacterium]